MTRTFFLVPLLCAAAVTPTTVAATGAREAQAPTAPRRLSRAGLEASTEQYGEMFKDSKYALWHANAAARRLLNRGVRAPDSGHPEWNGHADDAPRRPERC